MELTISKNAVKFLKKLPEKDKEKVQSKIRALFESIENSGLLPSGSLDIKALEGEWQGFLRMRVGKIRVIFTIDPKKDELQIYEIGFRGNIYKSLSLNHEITLEIESSKGSAL